MNLIDKLAILADAAKYDASCASSGGEQRKSDPGAGIGSSGGMGICHSYTPDGRCVSLLKILLTNFCVFDCQYCVNRRSSNTPRARFSVDEVVALTLDFYRRNYIEGLFLSSGVVRSPNHTMEELVRVARCLRLEHDFRGYIHLKTIPDVDEALIAEAGRYADRLSVNIELPREASLRSLAPEKTTRTIKLAMGQIRARKEAAENPRTPFAPAGQSTQLIVGADDSDDRTILELSETLYGAYRLRRVYYSAYSPIPQPSSALPPSAPPLQRENRLYQADWLIRSYGFRAAELLPEEGDGRLPLAIDPKLAWALTHRERFPVDVNSADKEMLLRVPGLGLRNVRRILAARRHQRLRYADLLRLRCDLGKARDFLIAADWLPRAELPSQRLHERAARQLELF
jgi:putative DNA modification/repair radical SAM protein